jgi:hypothetical protein
MDGWGLVFLLSFFFLKATMGSVRDQVQGSGFAVRPPFLSVPFLSNPVDSIRGCGLARVGWLLSAAAWSAPGGGGVGNLSLDKTK